MTPPVYSNVPLPTKLPAILIQPESGPSSKSVLGRLDVLPREVIAILESAAVKRERHLTFDGGEGRGPTISAHLVPLLCLAVLS
jgi:hypothetical protein